MADAGSGDEGEEVLSIGSLEGEVGQDGEDVEEKEVVGSKARASMALSRKEVAT